MSTPWNARGEYMEACSCDFLCPCIPKNASTPATHDFCKVALAFDITQGSFGDVDLAGVRFVMVAQSKAIMGEGDWVAGLIIDSAASDAQAAAVGAIASEAGHGPLANFSPLISEFRGVERHPIEFTKTGSGCEVKVDGLVDQRVDGIPSLSVPESFVCIDNSFHPVNKRLNLATAARNVIKAFGIDWKGTPESNNGHFAPFDWTGHAEAA